LWGLTEFLMTEADEAYVLFGLEIDGARRSVDGLERDAPATLSLIDKLMSVDF
jgi:hypothetical protein